MYNATTIYLARSLQMRVVSLFSGCGGMDLGFINAGFEIVYANDIDKYAVASYQHNIGDHIELADITQLKEEDLPSHDILIGGFPCQSFSMMGKQKGLEDTRGTLFFDIARMMAYHKPKIAVLENVRNLARHDGGKTIKVIQDTLDYLGYNTTLFYANSSDFGVPQTRNRVFIICVRKDNLYTFEAPAKQLLDKKLQDILEDTVDAKYYLSHKILPTILSHGTGGYYSKSEIDLEIARPLTATMAKMHRANQDNYVTMPSVAAEEAGKTNIRRLTPRECARLQGFPENYEIVVSDAQAYKQFGNAVTVNVAEAIAIQVKKLLYATKEEDSALTNYYKGMSPKELNKHFTWVEEIIKHLELVEGTYPHDLFSQPEHILVELGIVYSLVELKQYKEVFTKYISSHTWQQFLELLNKVEHINQHCVIPKLCKHCRRKLRKEAVEKASPTLVDLFCGAGGMSLGFNQAGFHTIFANDIEPSAIETYRYNHPEVLSKDIVLGDIKDLASEVQTHIKDSVDLLIGGPPCQGFSNANKQRMIDDPRNKLYKEYVHVVATVQPKFFVMENVQGMLTIADQVVEDFERAGYRVSYRVMNAADFGVPQNRKRIIFIGNRLGIDNVAVIEEIYKSIKDVETTTLKDAIADLPSLSALRKKNATNYESDEHGRLITKAPHIEPSNYVQEINQNRQQHFLYNHKARFNNDRDIEIFGRLHQGDDSSNEKIADIMPYTTRKEIFKDKYYKLIYNRPSKTITAHMKFDCNMYIHPTQARGLTQREAARVQSYPDDYFFKGSFTKIYMQIGNSVPPLMAKKIGEIIIKYINHKES